MPRRDTINDSDREQWIANDEGLYLWQRRNRLAMRRFIRENREEIDAAIRSVRDAKPAEKTWRDYAAY